MGGPTQRVVVLLRRFRQREGGNLYFATQSGIVLNAQFRLPIYQANNP